VILATGSAYRKLGLPREEELSGRGVSWCATCDGFFFRDQHIAVVGGGDSAVEEATFLTRFGESVTIVHRRDHLRASKIMADRATTNPKISFAWNSTVEDVLGEDSVTGITLRDVATGELRTLDIGGLFVAIGHDPRHELVKGQVTLDDEGYVVVDSPHTRTNLPGVFACGDLVDHTYRQAITAAGTGCAAALDVEHYLDGLPED
jgi:thioredoxin reductase (NADPH)